MITDGIVRDDARALVAELFDCHHSAIFAYLYRLCGAREWAEDLLQETFLRAFNARQRLPHVANRRAWLYRIATNVAFTALRRQRRFIWLPWRHTDDPALSRPDAGEQVGRGNAVERALATLPPDQRALLLLHNHHGFSMSELAEALAIREGAVRTRLCRARERFRRAYEREERDEQSR